MKKLVLSLMLLCLGSMIDSNARIVEITSKDAFERELAQAQVTVVVFWADWCGPCRLLMPRIASLNDQLDYEAVCFAKCDVETSYGKEIARLYNVNSIPTLLFFKNGILQERKLGPLSENDIKTIIQSLL